MPPSAGAAWGPAWRHTFGCIRRIAKTCVNCVEVLAIACINSGFGRIAFALVAPKPEALR